MIVFSFLVNKRFLFNVQFPFWMNYVSVWGNLATFWLMYIQWDDVCERISLGQSSIESSWHKFIFQVVTSLLGKLSNWRSIINISIVHRMGFPVIWDLGAIKSTGECLFCCFLALEWFREICLEYRVAFNFFSCPLGIFWFNGFKKLHDRFGSFFFILNLFFRNTNSCPNIISRIGRGRSWQSPIDFIFTGKLLFMEDRICVLLCIFSSGMHFEYTTIKEKICLFILFLFYY